MAPPPKDDPSLEEDEDDYDEAADSDFDLSPTSHPSASSSPSSSDNEALPSTTTTTPPRPKKRRKITRFAPAKPSSPPPPPGPPDLDSGDEATLKEARKSRRKQLKKGETAASDSDADADSQTPQGWRAKTRSMREREHEEKKASRLATIKGSTVDVDALWEKLNAPDALKLLSSTTASTPNVQAQDGHETLQSPTNRKGRPGPSLTNTELSPHTTTDPISEETITITRTYTFAGTTHSESKTVLASSAEAKLYLSQQAALKPTSQSTVKLDSSGRTIHRPIRKTSRFDPNISNIDSFKGHWSSQTGGVAGKKGPTGPKLNVVEKSKMDWASHVDAQGLKEELDVAAKAKDNYLQRTDFLKDVEGRKDEEARIARLKGK